MVIRQWMRKINFFPLVFGGLSPAKKKILLLPLVLLQSGFLTETWELRSLLTARYRATEPLHYLCPWESLQKIEEWRKLPEFKEFFVKAKSMSDEVTPLTMKSILHLERSQ